MPRQDLRTVENLAKQLVLPLSFPPVPAGLVYALDPNREVRVATVVLPKSVRGATRLSEDGTRWQILLNRRDSEVRRRFTLWHEGWHVLCGAGVAPRRVNLGEAYECGLADHFAANVLMPSDWIPVGSTATGMAAKFLVSRAAAHTRLRALGQQRFELIDAARTA